MSTRSDVMRWMVWSVVLAGCERDHVKREPVPAPTPWQPSCGPQFAPQPDRDPSPMCLVPAAEFTMGRSVEQGGNPLFDLPPHRVRVTRSFYIDQHEVTVEQMVRFANTVNNRCVDEGGSGDECMPTSLDAHYVDYDRKARDRQLVVAEGRGRKPAEASRRGAIAYCEWAGKQLPTEAQWVLAAFHDPATGADRLYPWGDTFIAENTYWGQDRGLAGIKPVASYPGDRSPVGALDMGGNTEEWLLDGFALTPTCSDRVCVDPVAPFSPDKLCVRVGQGPCGLARGGWAGAKSTSNRRMTHLLYASGFRCARSCSGGCEPPR